ncbi:hypothetical protein [Mesobacillus zeae]|uniref:hypothetical protein n=1 Tax=Mesobacillus zeae TaxID=1917180 RepID=UPI00300ABACA
MNKEGIEIFKNQIRVGDELYVGTRDYPYAGTVVDIKDNYFIIDEEGLKSHIYYCLVWIYSKQ